MKNTSNKLNQFKYTIKMIFNTIVIKSKIN